MKSYVYDPETETVVEKHKHFSSSHYIISDVQEPLKHPVTGKIHTSKSNFRRDTKAAGCEEIGNEKMETKHTPLDREKRRQVLRQTIGGMTDSQASEIMNRLSRQFGR